VPIDLEKRVWGGPVSAPWTVLKIDEQEPLENGFSVQVETVSGPGPLAVGARYTLFPLLGRTDVVDLATTELATLALRAVDPRSPDFEAVQSAETSSGILTVLRHVGHGAPSIASVHSVFADAREAGGGLVLRAPFPFRFVPMEPQARPIPYGLFVGIATVSLVIGLTRGLAR
jgi:hypothetical protein